MSENLSGVRSAMIRRNHSRVLALDDAHLCMATAFSIRWAPTSIGRGNAGVQRRNLQHLPGVHMEFGIIIDVTGTNMGYGFWNADI